MPVLFKNEGSTCFFNVAMQLLLSSPSFHVGVRTVPGGQDLVHGLRMIVDALERSREPSEAFVMSPRAFAPFLPLVRNAVATHRQHDATECVDEILDKLSVPGSTRPQPMLVGAEGPEAAMRAVLLSIAAHAGPFASMWVVTGEVQTCLNCDKVVRIEYTPVLWVSRVADRRTIPGALCESCGSRVGRKSETQIHHASESVLVRISRHNDDGSKNHRNVALHAGVTVAGRPYRMNCMVYHDGMTWQGGHYTCAMRHHVTGDWMLDSDTSCRFAPRDFDIQTHSMHKTYCALYSLDTASAATR